MRVGKTLMQMIIVNHLQQNWGETLIIFLEMVLFWEKSRPFVVDNYKVFSWNNDISHI